MPDTVIVVDDEREIADLIGLYLENDGYEVHKALSGAEALSFIEKSEPALAVLDIMLPDIDGFALLKKIREKHGFPVIMLTARVTDSDKILGLTMGADDYITKPFNPLEVTARVKTVLRRCRRASEPDCERDIRGLTISRLSHKCSLFGEAPPRRRQSLKFCGICAKTPGAWFRPRSCSRPCGGKNTSRQAATPSWRISAACVRKCASRQKIRGL